MVNLQKELEKSTKIKREREFSGLEAITDVNRLLENGTAEDKSILRDMGMFSQIQKAEALRGRKIELDEIEKKEGQIFTIDEIKVIACKYALKFLRTGYYKGNIDPMLPTKIKEFYAGRGEDLRRSDLQYKFFILAPQNAFNLKDEPLPIKHPDPMVFYRLDDDHFKLVHKWGADLTTWRSIVGWKYRNGFTYFLFWFISLATVLGSVALIIGGTIPAFIVLVIALVVTAVNSLASENLHNWEDRWTSEHKHHL